jgi:DHA1 family multidrug resistance protein-like MFS transporter
VADGRLAVAVGSSSVLSPAARRIVVLTCAATFIEATLFSAMAPLLPRYAQELGLSKSAAGTLSASYALGAVLLAVPVGLLLPRIGVKRCVLGGLALLSVSSAVFAVGTTIVVLDAARFFQGVAAPCLWVASLRWAVAVAPHTRRNEMVGTVMGVGIAGTLVGPVLGSVAGVIGTRPCFLVVAALAAALAVWALRARDVPTEPAPSARAVLGALRTDRLLIAGLWFTLLPACLYGTLAVLAPLRLDYLGAGTVVIAATFLAAAAIEAALSPVFGRVCDARGPLPAMRGALWASVVVTLLVAVAVGPYVMAPLIVIAGATFGMSWIAGNAVLAVGAAATALGQSVAFGLWMFGWAGGQMLGSAGGAGLAQLTADAVPYVLLAALGLGTLAVTRRMRVAAPSDGGSVPTSGTVAR